MGILQTSPKNFKKELENQLETVSLYPSPDTAVIQTKSRKPTRPALQQSQRLELRAQPQRFQGKNESKINAYDGRTQVLTTSQWPNSVHGVIAFKRNNITTWGTGILIGPHIVLTAGHNLYDCDTKTPTDVKSLQFLPGMNGQVLPFGVIEVEKNGRCDRERVREGKEDYGILILTKPVGEVTGYFGLACLEAEEFKEKRINVTGYPSDKVASKPNTYEMWGMEGEAAFVDETRGIINYLIDTESGQSGSGVWYQEGEDYYVCGVHISGTQLANTATLLTRAMYKQIHTWVQQMGFKEFLCRLKNKKKLRFYPQELSTECVSLLAKYNLNDLADLDLDHKGIGDEGAKALAQNTSWSNLSILDLSDNFIGVEGAKALAQNTSWINLSKLNLQKNTVGAEGAKALAQNISWIHLSELELSENDIGAEGAKALAQNTSWINLSRLHLGWNNLGREGAQALAQNTSWINLSQLYFHQNNIGAEGTKALAQASWKNLSHLQLYNNNIGAEGAMVLSRNTSWVNLSHLYLEENYIGAEGVKALAQNTSWINLSELTLGGNNVGAEGAQALAQNTSWKSLSQLSLRNNNIGTEGAKALAQNVSWIHLSYLDLSSNNIGAEGIKALAQNTSWIHLSSLNLSSNNIGAKGAKALTQNISWIKLSWIYLFGNNIGAEGAQALAHNTSWINLSGLELSRTDVGAEGIRVLKQNKTWKKGIEILLR